MMDITIEPTYNATIYVGLKRRYDGRVTSFEDAEKLIQEWVDNISYCVSVTRTKYIYKNGNEPGLIVGLINYPRFPQTSSQIRSYALDLAELMMKSFEQFRVTIVTNDETCMLSNGDLVE
jgi:hypothetical protein